MRDRRIDDLPALLRLPQRTHEHDGYPVRQSVVHADWLAAPDELLGAVALAADRVVGHAALHPGDDPDDAASLPQWQHATGRDGTELAVVTRLFTDRSVSGAGTVLLTHAMQQAARLGRTPVLVIDPDSPARGFCRRYSWQEIGIAVQQWGHRTVDAVLMVPNSARTA